MATNAVVRSRIDAGVKDRAAAVLGGMGLTVSDAIRIVLTRVANENELPFDLKPNKLTRQTMRKTADVYKRQAYEQAGSAPSRPRPFTFY